MILRKLSIRSFGTIEAFDADVFADVVAVFGRKADKIAAAVKVLCGVPLSARERRWIKDNTMLCAELHGKRAYRVHMSGADLTLSVTDLCTQSDCTEAYRRATMRCAEECATFVFSRVYRERYPQQLCRYSHDAGKASFCRDTDNIGRTEMFHSMARQFVRHFCPEPLREDKEYMLEVREDGRFTVMQGPYEPTLSETEKVLFAFLCFLHLFIFWNGIRHVVDLHREAMPLVLEDFVECIDESVPLLPYLRRARRECRQMLVVLPCDKDAARLADLPAVQTINADEKGIHSF